MDATHPSMTARGWALLALLSVLWGGTFMFVEVALTAVPPFTLVLARVAIAALALHALLLATGRRLPAGRDALGAYVGMGLLNNVVPFSLIAWGQTQIEGGLAAILNATTPLFTALLAHALTRDERLTAPRLAGVLVGLAGVAVMMGADALAGAGGTIPGQLACLAAALSYACSGVFGRRFKRLDLPPAVAATGQLTASSVLLLPVALLVDRPWAIAVPGPDVMAAVLAMALLSTALAYLLFFRILAAAGAVNVMLVTLLIPPSAMALGALVLGERLGWSAFAGLALIAAGLALIDGRLPRRLVGATARR
jgi:drug/metabolite transporter (DMT)-like permease